MRSRDPASERNERGPGRRVGQRRDDAEGPNAAARDGAGPVRRRGDGDSAHPQLPQQHPRPDEAGGRAARRRRGAQRRVLRSCLARRRGRDRQADGGPGSDHRRVDRGGRAGGNASEEINDRLRAVTRRTTLDEFWVTDPSGHAYLHSVPGIDFTFSPDRREQRQASAFWPLLGDERKVVIQRAQRREVDDRVFKYGGLRGRRATDRSGTRLCTSPHSAARSGSCGWSTRPPPPPGSSRFVSSTAI